MDFLLNLDRSVLIVTLAINLALASYIYARNPKNDVNRSFSFMLLSVSLWTFSFFMILWTKNVPMILFFRRLAPASSALIAYYLLYFSMVFPKRENPVPFLRRGLLFAPSVFFVLVSTTTPLLIKDFLITNPSDPHLGTPIFGPLYYVYAGYFICCFLGGIFNLIRKYFKLSGIERLQIIYVLFGIGIAGFLGLVMSLFMPLIGFSNLYSFGPPFTLITAFFVSYAIVRHKFLNVEDFLVKGLGLVLFIVLVLVTIFSVANNNISFLFPFYSASAEIFLAIFVFFHNWEGKANRTFSLLAISTALWTLCISMYGASLFSFDALFWSRMSAASISVMPALFLLFSKVFPKEEEISAKRVFYILFPGVVFLVLSFTDLIVSSVEISGGSFPLVLGKAFYFYSAYVLLDILYAFYILFKKNMLYSGISRTQIKYVFLGFFLGAIFPLFTNIILPVFGNSKLTVFGPSFAIITVMFLTYSIVKHRLMSIEIVVQKGFIYALATLSVFGLYVFAVLTSEFLFRNAVGYSSIFVSGIVAIFIALIYQPLNKWLLSISSNLFLGGKYDYQKTLRQISQAISTKIRLEDLTELIVSTFIGTMKISEISFLVLDKERGRFRSINIDLPAIQSRYKKIEIDEGSPIARWLNEYKDVLFADELDDEILKQESLYDEGKTKLKSLLDVKGEMESLGIDLWIPVISKGNLVGIISLGHKLSGDIFNSEDIALLTTLSSQVAVALENSSLYEEVLTVKNYMQDILENMVSGVVTLDNFGEIITFNLMAEKITGYSAKNVIGKKYSDIFSPKSPVSYVVEATMKNRCFNNYETSIVSKEKGQIEVSINSSILKDSHDKKRGVLLTISDLTEVKLLENKVRQADKIGALGTMAAGMAHEIKNPLSSMKVLSQLLPIKYNDEEFRRKFIEIMPREISRIDRIVESLLGFARATSPKFSPVYLKELIESDVVYFSEQAKNNNVKIITNYAELPLIDGDQDQLSQVFSNLILNAIQAMPEGGELRIETKEGKKIQNVLLSVLVEVTDTGHGISSDNLKKLFDPFFTTKYAGTGLGLTISHSIIAGHKGSIEVASEIGKGTKFLVALPVKQELI